MRHHLVLRILKMQRRGDRRRNRPYYCYCYQDTIIDFMCENVPFSSVTIKVGKYWKGMEFIDY